MQKVLDIRDRRVRFSVLLAALTLAVYAQVYHHGMLPVDDSHYVGENPHVQSGLNASSVQWAFSTTTVANWHPVTWLSHMVDCQIFGMHLGGYHLVNVLFHVLNVLLVLWLLERMTGAIWPSAFVAAVFAVHPLHVESVAWISERKDVLSTSFWLLTMTAYLAYVRKPVTSRYLLVLLPFALGLMAKPMLVTLPCVLLLMDYWPLDRFTVSTNLARGSRPRPSSRRGRAPSHPAFPWGILVEKVPLFALAALSCGITYYAQRNSGAVQTLDMLPPLERLANAVVTYAHYTVHTVWPVGLSTHYPLAEGGLPWWQVATAITFLAAVSAFVVSRRRDRPYLAVGWLWFLGTLVPVIGLVQVGLQAMADRYMYVPLIGLAIMAAWGVPAMIPKTRFTTRGLMAVATCAVAVLGLLSWIQVSYWGDNIALYRHETALRPDSWFAHGQLGMVLYREGRVDEAEREFLKTVELRPGHVDASLYLGLIEYGRKRYDQAVERYEAALEHAGGHPNRATVEINLGVALAACGRTEEAVDHYQAALQLEPDRAVGHYNLGNALALLNRRDEAASHYREALRLQPGQTAAQEQLERLLAAGPLNSSAETPPRLETAQDYYEYGNRLAEQNRFTEASVQYAAALRMNPNDRNARVNLGNAYAAMGKPREALAQYRDALDSEPDNVDILTNAGNALIELGQFSRACEEFNKALRIDPLEVDAYTGLAYAHTQLSQKDEAVRAYSKALEINPSNKTAKNALREIMQQTYTE